MEAYMSFIETKWIMINQNVGSSHLNLKSIYNNVFEWFETCLRLNLNNL